ncbi:sulfurtransferase [Salinibacillus xinjiangensis]|uniref:Sulfurtransferase n=1 Tax=Salinibacillus xinjiangensis TaxID=1229268 RepID=A0A6G1XBB2_9BACI|nr:sulfurtransferase [Salinibacillus xinjiangensis]MRG88301.1 sulfurtransferase [Salinibacillus xinjiangensis]
MKFIKDATWAYKKWQTGEDVIFVDCRFDLKDPLKGKQEFETDHLPGAVYFDLDQDLSSEVRSTGGRHPLPDIKQFVQKVQNAGISNDTTVIAYDQGHPFASRFCWLMTYLGHEKTYVINRGYQEWVDQGYPTETETKAKEKGDFQPTIQTNLAVNQQYVKENRTNPNTALIDSRSFERYAGNREPIDAKAGHIPGAEHYDWVNLFTEKGYWKESSDLKKHFEGLVNYEEIIVYCGSGVTATPNVIGLWEAQLPNVKLYVGSWSDWISNPANPIETTT